MVSLALRSVLPSSSLLRYPNFLRTTQAILTSANNAAEEIDRILLAALTTARPAYLTLPTDLVFAPVDKTRLANPIIPSRVSFREKSVLPTGKKIEEEEQKRLEFVVGEIVRLWDKATNPIVLVRRPDIPSPVLD